MQTEWSRRSDVTYIHQVHVNALFIFVYFILPIKTFIRGSRLKGVIEGYIRDNHHHFPYKKGAPVVVVKRFTDIPINRGLNLKKIEPQFGFYRIGFFGNT